MTTREFTPAYAFIALQTLKRPSRVPIRSTSPSRPPFFSRDYDTVMRAFNRLDASAVMISDHTAFRVDWMPFAGLRESGLGVGGIPFTFHDMQLETMFVGSVPREVQEPEDVVRRRAAT